ncbi:MAG: hypothetical protein ABIW76_01175 [Fibrobacteria bacterium]
MVDKRLGLALGALLMSAVLAGAMDTKVDYKPLKITGVQEFGQIQSGMLISTPYQPMSAEWLDHFGSFLTQEAKVNERLLIQIGLGGTFQNGKPERVDEKFGGSQYKMFFIGPTIAKATVLFGEDRAKPAFSIGGGIFPFKYNSQAVNLGEYLFRTGAYPTYIMNGGLLMIGDNAAYLQGYHAAARLGNLDLDLLMTTETGMPPLYDWSLAALANYRIMDGAIEVGAGVNFKRILQVDPKRTVVDSAANSYFTRNGRHYVGDPSYYQEQFNFYDFKITNAKSPTSDTIGFGAKRDAAKAAADSVASWIDPVTRTVPGASKFTPAGPIFMAKAGVDFKKLFGIETKSPKDMILYGEWALLGWENFPVYYEKRTDRMPIMFGFNLPTFGLLNLFALQGEHFSSPFQNNSYSLGGSNYATPWYPNGTTKEFSEKEYNDLSTKDDWAWSVLVQRSFYRSFTLSGQIARDHLRTVGTDWFYGSRLEPTEDLHKISDWYWAFQLAWSI